VFTGIVEAVGQVRSTVASGIGRRLVLDIGQLAERPELGGSVSINGVCLTVVELKWPEAAFDVVAETVARSNLGELGPGGRVNLELSLRVSDRIEGHFVLGHVDTTCRIGRVQDEPPGRRLFFEPSDLEYLRYVVPKGSVALDGISLTVADRSDRGFSVAIIPETLRRTTLVDKGVGAVVNLETDVLVKAVVQRLEGSAGDRDGRLIETLRRSGFEVG